MGISRKSLHRVYTLKKRRRRSNDNSDHQTANSPINSRTLSRLYRKVHDRMRDAEGLLPQEAFDELLKFLFYKDCVEMRTEKSILRSNSRRHESPVEIRKTFSTELASRVPWTLQLWPAGHFNLSDTTLLDLQKQFADVYLNELSLDIRSTALWTFVSPDVRKSLGIFTTPEDVVRTMIDIVAPSPSDIVLDPACGTGTFLMETVRFLGKKRLGGPISIYGIDKNPRMLFLAALNFGHSSDAIFHKACMDSLRELGHSKNAPLNLLPNSVDIILTNPPFGVTVTRDTGILDLFETGGVGSHKEHGRVPSEVLFTELCLRLLKPGGRLGIVLPRSVITNERLGPQRRSIGQLGYLTEIIDLPPETFVSTGTQTATVAAFFRKHAPGRQCSNTTVRVCRVTNVGFDSTGRRREGNQLPIVAKRLVEHNPASEPAVSTYPGIDSTETLCRAAEFLFHRNGPRNGKVLREFVEFANAGRTPSRNAYTEDGMFILKVGNLTGRGIDWEPRDRNFVSSQESIRRAKNYKLTIRKGDILLTSSAHAARYIAKKVDVVANIPHDYKGLTFVGELIRLRPKRGIDPFVLLASLRHPRVRGDLQACTRGQTAHLNPNDLLEVTVPYDLLEPSQDLIRVANILRREARLAFELNSVAAEALKLLELAGASTTTI